MGCTRAGAAQCHPGEQRVLLLRWRPSALPSPSSSSRELGDEPKPPAGGWHSPPSPPGFSWPGQKGVGRVQDQVSLSPQFAVKGFQARAAFYLQASVILRCFVYKNQKDILPVDLFFFLQTKKQLQHRVVSGVSRTSVVGLGHLMRCDRQGG